MELIIKYQDTHSRGQLLLRTLFGGFYIILPHAFLLFFIQLWGAILSFIAWWAVLINGKYPQSFFDYQLKSRKWGLRVSARINNLTDGYPSFGLNAEDENTDIKLVNPDSLSRGVLLLRTFFGFIYVIIPHGFLLIFRFIATFFLMFLSWWAILFTGKYPKSWFDFNVGTLRWSLRVGFYMSFMTDVYPPFSGK